MAINPAGGEGGGPVLDNWCLLTTVSWSLETGAVSFAVPTVGSADLAWLESRVRREVPVLGLSATGEDWGADLPPVFFEAYGLGNLPGLVFTGVWPGGHAEQAGLKLLAPLASDLNHQVARYGGDVIDAIDGQPVSGYQSEGFDKSWSEKQR